jgi:Cu2+-containing amine oxidase
MIARLLPLAALALAGTAQAQPRPDFPDIRDRLFERLRLLCPNAIVQNFPTSGPVRTTWQICWREVAGYDSLNNPNGLVIGPVYFRTSPGAPYVKVIHDMRVSDYFVPYHPGSPRYYDLSFFNFQLTSVSAADCPASVGGTLLSSKVCKEVHDRGLMWKDYAGVRRGEELVLWGAINAANYRYIQEYRFRDDGFIIGRVGATAQNLPGMESVTHTHGAYWRIDTDFGGISPNNVAQITHSESILNPFGSASDSVTPVTTGKGFIWSPRAHTTLAVSNPNMKNRRGNRPEYHLVEQVTGGGIAAHFEPFSRNDLWVTRYSGSQFAASKLPSYTGTNVANSDVVLWIKTPIHHTPRDEDGLTGTGSVNGTADVMWSGFALIPHNLFSCSPFYPNCP